MINDPTPDLYEILDASNLSGGYLLQNKSMSKLVTEIRNGIVVRMRDYIEQREIEIRKELTNGE